MVPEVKIHRVGERWKNKKLKDHISFTHWKSKETENRKRSKAITPHPGKARPPVMYFFQQDSIS